MQFDKLTLKTQEIIQASQQLAERYGNQQIEPDHLIQDPLSIKILGGSVGEGDDVRVDVEEAQIVFQ